MLNSFEISLEGFEISLIRPDNPSISNPYQSDVSIDTSGGGDHASLLNPQNRRDFLPPNSSKMRKEPSTIELSRNRPNIEETEVSEEEDDDHNQRLIGRDFLVQGDASNLQNSLELSLITELRRLTFKTELRKPPNAKEPSFSHENLQNATKSRKYEISVEKEEEFRKDSEDSPNKYHKIILGDHPWESSFSPNSKQLRSNDHFYLLEHGRKEFSGENERSNEKYNKNLNFNEFFEFNHFL